MPVYNIGRVATMTHLSEFTIRAWERRYGATTPTRSESGRRTYSEKEIEKLKLLKQLTDAGHAIGEIAHLDSRHLMSLHKVGLKTDPATQTIHSILSAVAAMDLQKVSALLKKAQLERDTRSFLVDFISPLLSALGLAVSEGRLDVYQEHSASAFIRNLLSGVLYSTEQLVENDNGRSIVFAAPEGDHHEFGILIAAILAALRGERVFYLGPNLPAESLVRALNALHADVAVISCIAPIGTLSTSKWTQFAKKVVASTNEGVSFWFAGPRTDEVRHLPEFKDHSISILARYQDFEKALQKHTMSR